MLHCARHTAAQRTASKGGEAAAQAARRRQGCGSRGSGGAGGGRCSIEAHVSERQPCKAACRSAAAGASTVRPVVGAHRRAAAGSRQPAGNTFLVSALLDRSCWCAAGRIRIIVLGGVTNLISSEIDLILSGTCSGCGRAGRARCRCNRGGGGIRGGGHLAAQRVRVRDRPGCG